MKTARREWLYDGIQESGLTRKAVANKCSISVRSLNAYLAGSRNISIVFLIKASSALSLDLSEAIKREARYIEGKYTAS